MARTRTKKPLTNLQKRHAARTKLMMKFWMAMHKADIPPEQEWDAQEKISIEALTEILRSKEARWHVQAGGGDSQYS